MSNRSNVFIVDNNAEELMQLIAFMEDHYELAEVASGWECVSQAAIASPDLILIDDMIQDPNCYDICQALKDDSATGEIPIILMSDLNADELEDEVDFLGTDDYICKPIAKAELLEKIDTLLSFKQAH